ncbi:MAG: hypothetical protein AB7O78_08505 [Thermoleophilia bacterium]
MTFGRRRIAALAAGAVAVAGISAGAVAATNGSSDEASDLAAAINNRAGTSITADQVEGAFQDLLKARLDEAVKAGRITQAQADEMLKRAQDAPGLPGFGGPGHGPGPGFGHGGPGMRGGEVMTKVAKSLDLTEEQLRDRLESGTTLAQVAKAQGVSRADLIATLSAALKAEGVPAARVADLAKHIADDDHDGPGPRGGRGFHP